MKYVYNPFTGTFDSQAVIDIGDVVQGGTVGSVLFIGADGTLAELNSGFTFDGSTLQLNPAGVQEKIILVGSTALANPAYIHAQDSNNDDSGVDMWVLNTSTADESNAAYWLEGNNRAVGAGLVVDGLGTYSDGIGAPAVVMDVYTNHPYVINTNFTARVKVNNDGNILLGDTTTNYTNVGTDGTITQVGTARIDWTKIAANGITATGCTITSQTVSMLQTDNDGNMVTCTEVASTPNYLVVDFTGVTAFNWVRVLANYQGNSQHNLVVEVEITPFNGSAWHTFDSIAHQSATGMTHEDHSFFIPSDTAYINSGVVKVRFLHSATEANGHTWEFDEVSLYQ